MTKEEFVATFDEIMDAFDNGDSMAFINHKKGLVVCCKELGFQEGARQNMLFDEGKDPEDDETYKFYCNFHWGLVYFIDGDGHPCDDRSLDSIWANYEVLKDSLVVGGLDWID